eukprot:12170755-Alexandrium_andersonii.AAC.1
MHLDRTFWSAPPVRSIAANTHPFSLIFFGHARWNAARKRWHGTQTACAECASAPLSLIHI